MRKLILASGMVTVAAICFLTSAATLKGRIAVSADGNQHDSDDIGATPATLAILAAHGLQDRLVHYDYASHIWDTDNAQELEMEKSALEGAQQFGFSTSKFFNAYRNQQAAENSIAAAVNASSASDSLFFLIGGPMEVAYKGLEKALAAKRIYVRCISHSAWNNNHGSKDHNGRTVDDIKALGVVWDQIRDQNGGFNTSKESDKWSYWDWLKNAREPSLQWLYSRIQAVGRPDVSDCGMAWYLLTGNENGTYNDLKILLLDPPYSLSGPGTSVVRLTRRAAGNSSSAINVDNYTTSGVFTLSGRSIISITPSRINTTTKAAQSTYLHNIGGKTVIVPALP